VIYFRTGVNGTGKTSGLIGEFYDEIDKGRKLYVHGIKDLAIDHTPLVCDNDICDVCPAIKKDDPNALRLEEWYKVCDPGSLIIADEAQFQFPISYKNKAVLDAFSIHRHDGKDIYFLTQHPMMLCVGLRRLAAGHQHIFYDFLGRHKWSWNECSQNLSKTRAEVTRYKLDKRTFKLYTSASSHSELDRKIPKSVFVFFIAIFITLTILYRVYLHRTEKPASQSVPALIAPASEPVAPSVALLVPTAPAPVPTVPTAPAPVVQQQGVPVGNKVSNQLVATVLPSYRCIGFVSKGGVTYRFCHTSDNQLVYVKV